MIFDAVDVFSRLDIPAGGTKMRSTLSSAVTGLRITDGVGVREDEDGDNKDDGIGEI